MAGWRSMRLDDMETHVWEDTGIAWHPVRGHLGVRAFGVAAFTADAGRDVIEPHRDADGRGQQELYVVARGRATFTLDGETVDAPAGTFVFVEDPGVHRHAVAAEDRTAVLAFGGDPVFVPSGHEYIVRVRGTRAADPARALQIARDGVRELPESAGARYELALAAGEDEARDALARAVAEVPELAEVARRDGIAHLLSR
jgi:quercetin dioxygenase-like cupin family protein